MIESSAPTCAEQVCTVCGASGVRIWRPAQSWPDRLLCFTCACADQHKDIVEMAAEKSDQIGWLVPAVPDGEGSWWGYTSVPQAGVDAWHALPLASPASQEPKP